MDGWMSKNKTGGIESWKWSIQEEFSTETHRTECILKTTEEKYVQLNMVLMPRGKLRRTFPRLQISSSNLYTGFNQTTNVIHND